MQLFLETPEMRARRQERSDGACAAEPRYGGVPGVAAPAAPPARIGLFDAEPPTQAAQARTASTQTVHESAPRPDDRYSLEQESYQEELAFNKRRARQSIRRAVVRTLLIVVAVPVVLAAIFVAAYAFTCILDGATPEELVVLLQELFQDVANLVRNLVGQVV